MHKVDKISQPDQKFGKLPLPTCGVSLSFCPSLELDWLAMQCVMHPVKLLIGDGEYW